MSEIQHIPHVSTLPNDARVGDIVIKTGTNAGLYVCLATNVWSGPFVTSAAAGTRSIVFAIDGGGSALTTGVKADVYVPYACTITAVTMLADQSGSVVLDIWKDTRANYPPTVADTIIGGGGTKPTISSATNSHTSTLTNWTTGISAGDTLRFNIDSIATITRLHLALTVTV